MPVDGVSGNGPDLNQSKDIQRSSEVGHVAGREISQNPEGFLQKIIKMIASLFEQNVSKQQEKTSAEPMAKIEVHSQDGKGVALQQKAEHVAQQGASPLAAAHHAVEEELTLEQQQLRADLFGAIDQEGFVSQKPSAACGFIRENSELEFDKQFALEVMRKITNIKFNERQALEAAQGMTQTLGKEDAAIIKEHIIAHLQSAEFTNPNPTSALQDPKGIEIQDPKWAQDNRWKYI